MVNTTPSIEMFLLKFSLINSIVFIREESPSNAKNSHCSGIMIDVEATIALIVNRPRAGGQSIKTKS